MSVFWFEPTADIVANHLLSEDVPEEVMDRALRVRRAADVSGRVRGPRLPVGVGLEGIQGRRDRSAGSSCRPACSSPTSCRSRSSPPRPRPRSASTTKTSTSSAPPRASATGRCWKSCGGSRSSSTARQPSTPPSAGILLADTKFEFGRHAGAEIVLGDEVLTPDSSRFWPADSYAAGRDPALLRQAIRARLGRSTGLGQTARRRRSCRPTWSSRPGPNTSRPTSGSRGCSF